MNNVYRQVLKSLTIARQQLREAQGAVVSFDHEVGRLQSELDHTYGREARQSLREQIASARDSRAQAQDSRKHFLTEVQRLEALARGSESQQALRRFSRELRSLEPCCNGGTQSEKAKAAQQRQMNRFLEEVVA